MNRKSLLISLTLALALTLLIVGVAMAASQADTNAPDCWNTITTKKVTDPAGGQDFDFTLKKYSTTIDTFSLDDQGTHTKTTNAWATFYLKETPKDGYHLTDIACTYNSSNGTHPHFTYDVLNYKVTIDTASHSFDGDINCTFTNVRDSYDYGDLPETYGMTTFAQDGARHTPGNLFLGSTVDAEFDGLPSAGATGDDTDDTSDEDGVARVGAWGTDPAGQGHLQITVSGEGCLLGWLDFGNTNTGDLGADGMFAPFTYIGDATLYDEYIIQNVHVTGAGTYDFYFDLPDDFGNVAVFGRFRLLPLEVGGCLGSGTSLPDGGLQGYANNGEVEDYSWLFGPSAISLQSFAAEPTSSAPVVSLIIVVLSVGVLSILWKILQKAQG
jgi:hypothetical protein